MSTVIDFIRNEDGNTAIEYGVIAAHVSILVFLTLGLVGNNLSYIFDQIDFVFAGT
jgi:Flp pilus assembly pilin Flp